MSRLMQQVRWFVRVLNKWNVEKNPFKLDFRYYFIIRAYHDVIK